MSSTGAHLEVTRLHKTFGARPVLRGLDLSVRSGELVAVVGRSGCGKSTLLRVIAGLDGSYGGQVSMDGKVIVGAAADTRMIFQEARLLPWASVLDNVLLGARTESKGRANAKELRAHGHELLQNVGLADRESDWPGRLSGGQKQRVALARGLMSDPRLLLLDEPLGALDAFTRIEMQQLVERIWLERRFTAVLVTHEIQEAVALADRVIVLESGQASVEVAITMPRPRVRESREFVEATARILNQILEGSAAAVTAPRVSAAPGEDVSGTFDVVTLGADSARSTVRALHRRSVP
jgi:sulfonate transport system ATP-binding protein